MQGGGGRRVRVRHRGHGRGELDWPATSVMVDASPTARCALPFSPRRRPTTRSKAARRGMGWTSASTRRARNSRWCIDLEPHWRAVDVDGDMMLNATEVAALLERLQRIITIKQRRRQLARRLSRTRFERIVALGDSGDVRTARPSIRGGSAAITRCRWTSSSADGQARHVEPPCPGGQPRPEPLRPRASTHRHRERRVLRRDAGQGRLAWALNALLRPGPPGLWGRVHNKLFAGSAGAIILVLWVLPSVIYGLVELLLSRACRRSAIAAEQSTHSRLTMAKLDAAAASAARLRFRVSGTLMQFGWMLTAPANAPMPASPWPVDNRCATAFENVVGAFLYYISA